ncbi:hypothetical protein E1161_12390 [Saccharopolyspora aridisoli]|uniref:Uncharacterized protein n=1 Tax=Saccharopolyspora aridisoli TaxID=2530385 RepID=A0A4R4V138_9PSEU|nr:hypothetical protein [Saccharopolyspora aridisoli]TDC92879.1 hypothetical protein E1161_12390 [Saccharopolyspora aridisoli]
MVIDPLTDTAPVGGLHKFDLGMVPASVTPPPSWRRAAWFAIASSVAALGGLVFATALVSNHHTTHIEGLELPSMPRGGSYPPLSRDPYFLTGDPTRPSVASSTSTSSGRPNQLAPGVPPTGTPEPTAPGEHAGDEPADEPADDEEPGTPGSGAPGTGTPPGTSRPPTTEAPQLLQLTDTEGMQRTSEQYYGAISSGDLPGAYAMTTGALRAEGYESFAARYSYATRIEVLQVYATPTSTAHTLRLTLPDGSERMERRVLRYEMAESPMISSDERVS